MSVIVPTSVIFIVPVETVSELTEKELPLWAVPSGDVVPVPLVVEIDRLHDALPVSDLLLYTTNVQVPFGFSPSNTESDPS
jgi:hypothetical protein